MTSKLLLIVNKPNVELVLAKDFIIQTVRDDLFIRKLDQIKKHLQSYTIKNDELYNGNTKVNYPIKLYLKDQFGINQESKIVKVLNRHKHSYEIRIEREPGRHTAYTHRLTYCLDNKLSSYILTFGFTKSTDDSRSMYRDVTDECAKETDIIKIDLLNEKYIKWLGEEDYNEL